MNVDIPTEASKAAPGIIGAIVALQWVRGSPMQRFAAFLGGTGASYYGAEQVAAWAHLAPGLSGFLVGLFGMAIVGRVFEAIEQMHLAPIMQKILRKLGL